MNPLFRGLPLRGTSDPKATPEPQRGGELAPKC